MRACEEADFELSWKGPEEGHGEADWTLRMDVALPVGGALKTVAGMDGAFLFESHGEATQRRQG